MASTIDEDGFPVVADFDYTDQRRGMMVMVGEHTVWIAPGLVDRFVYHLYEDYKEWKEARKMSQDALESRNQTPQHTSHQ